MPPIMDAATASNCEDEHPSFREVIDADTAVARRRLVEALASGGQTCDLLRIGDGAALASATARRFGRIETTIALDAYLEVARTEPASLFGGARTRSRDTGTDAMAATIGAELDDLAVGLARDAEPVRLFGLIFAIERARHLLFVSHPAAFALGRPDGRRLALAGTLSPALTRRFAALIDAIGATSGDQALVMAQAHAAYGVIEIMMQAWMAGWPPVATGVDPCPQPSVAAN